MSEKEITLDLETQTYVEEKTKRTRKVPCSDKMLENLAKGREKRKQLLEEKKKQKEIENLCKEKEQLKKEKEEFDKFKKTNFEVNEVKKPRKKYTRKPKQEQIIPENSDTSSSEDYIVEKQKPTKICLLYTSDAADE